MYRFEDIENKRILLSFLNWGKGHLSRCIDVCRRLQQQGNTIFVACSPEDIEVLKSYTPSIEHISFPGYPFQFSERGNFTNDLWKNKKILSRFIIREQKEVEKLVRTFRINFVVSDHRYGFRSKTIPSIFITHQVYLALKWWQQPAQWLHKKWMKQFSHIWIMDEEHNPLAGRLSRKGNLKNALYIGHFSRFEENSNTEKIQQIGVCNGPHPYNRQLLEQLLQNKNLDLILSPISHDDKRVMKPGNWKETDKLFYPAKTIHSYCGYSTLMDLKRLRCKGELIPTPGQSEQIYLYHYHNGRFDFR